MTGCRRGLDSGWIFGQCLKNRLQLNAESGVRTDLISHARHDIAEGGVPEQVLSELPGEYRLDEGFASPPRIGRSNLLKACPDSRVEAGFCQCIGRVALRLIGTGGEGASG